MDNKKIVVERPLQKRLFLTAKIMNIMFILILFFGMLVYILFFPRTTESNYDSNLKEFPEFTTQAFFSGDYFADISAYLSDTIHGRDYIKDMAAQIKVIYGITENEQVFGDPEVPLLIDNSSEDAFTETESDENISKSTDNSVTSISNSGSNSTEVNSSSDTESKENTPFEQISEGKVILGTRAMELYTGSTRNSIKYAEYLNAYAEQLGSKVNVYSMVIPKSCAYYIQGSKKYSDFWKYTVNDLDAINNTLSGVKSVDVYNALLPHTKEDIYFRTDIHWTGLGAYYAAEAFAKTAEVPFANLSTYTKDVRNGYVGTMYQFTNNSPTLLNNPEDFVTYRPSASYTATFYNQKFENEFKHDLFFYVNEEKKSSWYLAFLNGDNNAIKIKSNECSNGRKLVIFKDSYGNPIAPYLLQSFEEIYVIDFRKYELNAIDLINENGITDVLFAVSAFSASNTTINKEIDNIRLK